MLRLELPYPPSVNHYWRNVGRRTLVSREGRQYRQRVGWAVWLTVGQAEPLLGPLRMDVRLHPPDRRRRDVDNALKAVLDSLEASHIYQDDGQIVDLRVRRLDPIQGGLAIVEIEEVQDDDAEGGA